MRTADADAECGSSMNRPLEQGCPTLGPRAQLGPLGKNFGPAEAKINYPMIYTKSRYANLPAVNQGRSNGRKGGNPPTPRNEKLCCRKMLYPKALFLVINFPKLVRIPIFQLTFYQNFSRFSQNFIRICFSSKRAKK